MRQNVRAVRLPLLLLSLLGGTLFWLSISSGIKGAAARQDAPPAGVTDVVSNGEQLSFTLHLPTYEIDAAGNLQAADLENVTTVPGAPAIPYFSTLIALPPEAEAQVDVRVSEITELVLSRAPRPAPSPAETAPLPEDMADGPVQLDGVYAPDPTYYASDAYFPDVRYQLSEPTYYRDVRYVQLDLFPLQYRPANRTLSHAKTLHVTLTFAGASRAPRRPAGGEVDLSLLQGEILNVEQVAGWRSLPPDPPAEATELPVDRPLFKVEVDADGIYAITGADLQSAGMQLGSVDPATLEMLYRGEPVAYQFRDQDEDGNFDPEDAVYFYGWAFDGPRTERQFITSNVFWLWAGGNGLQIEQAPNPAGAPTLASFLETLTREEENVYMHTRTNNWDLFPNEPDSWYWEIITKPPTTTLPVKVITHEISLPDPAPEGDPALLTVEYLSDYRPAWQLHEMSVHLNSDAAHQGYHPWRNVENVNVEATVPVTALLDGPNQVVSTISTANSTTTYYYLNRITVEYARRLRAVGDQLIFGDQAAPHTYAVGGFDSGDPASALVWDISERRQPRQVELAAGAISGSGSYTYTFGTDRQGAARFIATTEAQVLTPTLSRYLPVDLDPAGAGADWVAISHASLMDAVAPLAAHRQETIYGGLTTHVVDVEDVINQYGYGLPLPGAIRAYLAYAFENWALPPSYVLLVGDATVNPRDLDCAQELTLGDCDYWGPENDPNLVPTDITFTDRIQGTVISDHTFVLLSGNDLVPEMAIGRLAAQTPAEVTYAIDKIVQYEQSYRTAGWKDNVLFLSDNTDGGGNFCAANEAARPFFPDSVNQIHLCLEPDPPASSVTTTDVVELMAEMDYWVNYPERGVSMVNYRGHGGVYLWGGAPQPFFRVPTDKMMAEWEAAGAKPEDKPVDSRGWWGNYGNPAILLSFDCLDGFFAYPGVPALGEAFLHLEHTGSAAHWSSAGLGYTYEHSVLQEYFYKGVYEQNLETLGEAINYSKLKYGERMNEDSEIYAFTLLGDPAMRIFGPSTQHVYLPTAISP